ncbi:MAG: hypothetical protein KDD02_06530 [Phaeodactylibacter sp.]|nr:hypothetical protein [Phaeodactylibacter sp.]MCB9299093.1 hypothetical protein [Lewinellaceae bacterium]
MKDLKELVYIVSKNKLKAIERLDTNKANRVSAFYEKLVNNDLEDDKEALEYFFPNAKNSTPYRKLKAMLRKRLISTLFSIDFKQPSYTDRQRAYYECHKEWAAAKILLGKNAWDACVEICERILKYAIKYEFTEMTLDLLRILRLHYSTRMGNQGKFEEYKKMHQEYEAVFIAENKAELFYCELVMPYVKNQAAKEGLQELALQYFGEIKASMEEHSSYQLHLYGSMIRLMTFTMVNDYRNALAVCDDMIDFFEAKPYEANTPLQAAYYQKLVCHSQLRQFLQGKLAAQKCIALIEEGSVNWFRYHELYFSLAMQTGQYQEAFDIFYKVTAHRRFAYLPSNDQEIWIIYEAYLYYLADIEKISLPMGEERFNKFRLGRFLNQTPIFSKDKRGMNVAILVIQTLFLIQQKKYNRAIDRLEAIEKYCNRYLRKDDTIRSYYFIKMLLAIPMASFHRRRVARHAAPYLEKLKKTPLESARQSYKIEIVPYEQLWEFALDSLEERVYV